jgi:hypothetical protein
VRALAHSSALNNAVRAGKNMRSSDKLAVLRGSTCASANTGILSASSTIFASIAPIRGEGGSREEGKKIKKLENLNKPKKFKRDISKCRKSRSTVPPTLHRVVPWDAVEAMKQF